MTKHEYQEYIDFAMKADYEGGLVEALLGYGLSCPSKDLQDIADKMKELEKEFFQLFKIECGMSYSDALEIGYKQD